MDNDNGSGSGPRHRGDRGHHFSFEGRSARRGRFDWRQPRVFATIAGTVAIVLFLTVIVIVRWGNRAVGDDGPIVTQRQLELAKMPSFIVINSDDQRWDTLKYMPHVENMLVKHGVTFTNSFVVNPVCCPSRAALMTGSYSHTNGVYDNKGPEGGFFSFNDGGTMGTFVDQDYSTGLFGKYLNNYAAAAAQGVIPRGWDRWVAFDREGYYDYALNEDGSFNQYGHREVDYSIGVLTSRIKDFIETTEGPLLVYYTPPTPHLPAIPMAEDAQKFDKLSPWRPPAYNEADLTDKPEFIQHGPPLTPAEARAIDDFRLDQLRSLQALDRSVGEIVDTLEATGRLDNTMIIYTSDNGMLWGEHRLKGKNVAYEESIRVPLVIRYDPWVDGPRTDDHLIANIDIVPTIVEMANAKAYRPDGMSMVPLLRDNPRAKWREEFLIEHYAEKTTQKVPTFCAVRGVRYKLVDYSWGFDELYDLEEDPDELQNVIADPEYADVLADMQSKLDVLCQPKPPRSVDEEGVII